MLLNDILAEVSPLLRSGAALHWLVPFEKRPIDKDWSDLPRSRRADLESSFRPNANIGVRLGEPSQIDGLYLHLIDLDIRDPAQADDAWAALLAMLPQARSLPSVISGSGSGSRHIYFLTDRPFRKKNLAKSDGFKIVDGTKKRDWEIDLMGTGSQAVLPPSIHPDTRKPYRWERPINLDLVAFNSGPIISADAVRAWGANDSVPADDDDDAMENYTLNIERAEIEAIIADLPADWVEDRDTWVTVGAALHHQFDGSREGFDLWCEWAQQSKKFDRKDSARVWRSFRGSANPVRMPTLIQAANSNRLAQEIEPVTGTSLVDLFTDMPPAPLTEWRSLLHRNSEGELKTTLHNIALIVQHDPRTAGIIAFNEFEQSTVLIKSPGRVQKKREKSKPVINLEGEIWRVKDSLNGDSWRDAHDISVRRMIEAPTTQGGYGIKVSQRDLEGAIVFSAVDNRFHPIRNRLDAFASGWDGKRRIETFFIDYLNCDDTPYHRQAAVTMLLGAVSRIYEPGHKFDFVAILEGAQGAGKSTFISTLGMNWSSELTGDISDTNKMIEAMQGSWIIEIGELSSMHRAEVNSLKAFVSRTEDKGRLAWEKRVAVYPRQCIFIGSTNDQEYLRDSTGNRRYWPIVCNLDGRMIDNLKLRQEVSQIWAEAVLMYREMRRSMPIGDLPLYISDRAAADEAKLIQLDKMVETSEDALAGKILAWLDRPVGDGFDDGGMAHNETCIGQVWEEVLERSGPIPQVEAIKIGRAMRIVGWPRSRGPIGTSELNARYGRCRVYFRPS